MASTDFIKTHARERFLNCKRGSIGLLLVIFFSVVNGKIPAQESSGKRVANAPEKGLSNIERAVLSSQISQMMERDQQFRAYMTYETLDDAEIEKLSGLEIGALMEAMKANRGKLSPAEKQLLNQLQAKNDRKNHEQLVAIIKKHGYPSPKRLGTEVEDVFPLLLHPHVEFAEIETYLQEMMTLLRPEVAAGRMEAMQYAIFVDNILGKILRRPQKYGTNQVFDTNTQSIGPPRIANLEETNRARREIGLPALKKGEYQLVDQDKSEAK